MGDLRHLSRGEVEAMAAELSIGYAEALGREKEALVRVDKALALGRRLERLLNDAEAENAKLHNELKYVRECWAEDAPARRAYQAARRGKAAPAPGRS